MSENKKELDTSLIICCVFGFLGIDKLYKKDTQWFLIKLGVTIVGTVLLILGSNTAFIFSVFGWIVNFVVFAWWLVDLIFACIDKYEINPLDYLKK